MVMLMLDPLRRQSGARCLAVIEHAQADSLILVSDGGAAREARKTFLTRTKDRPHLQQLLQWGAVVSTVQKAADRAK
jgi:hypothetical protein